MELRMSSNVSRVLVTSLATVLVSFAWNIAQTEEAHADVLIGVDANGGFNIGELSTEGIGLGANLRVGYSFDIPLLRLAPEVQVGYMGFSVPNPDTAGAVDAAAAADLRTFSGRGGLRIGYGGLLFGVSAYGHAGYGMTMTQSSGADTIRADGPSFDGGLAVDVTAIPFVNIGLHGGYNTILLADAEPLRWIDAGLHVEVVF
jgi:hypothetical protein